MLKFLFLLHRWLGIGLGLLMLLWCLSGFVMMYKPYPELNEQEALALQQPLALGQCCAPGWDHALRASGGYGTFRLRMLDGRPVLQLNGPYGLETLDLSTGEAFERVTQSRAAGESAALAARQGLPGSRYLGSIERDQWTVYGSFNAHRPLHHFAADDAAGTEWYLSSRSGEVLQYSTASDRFWGFAGAVIHWLYPTQLRQHVALWSQTVIWLTVLGLLLTLTGLYFGLRQYKQRSRGRRSPYRGLALVHHYGGLAFGLLTLSWVLSGLFSMQPWGLMAGEGAGGERALLRGGGMSSAEVREAVEASRALPLDGVVEVRGARLLGETALLALDATGEMARYLPGASNPVTLDAGRLANIADLLAGEAGLREAVLLNSEDAYYYHHHERVRLPVYRVIRDDAEATRYYLDPRSGELLRKVDAEGRWYRWLHYGLHRGDFSAFLRNRPVWDLLMWPLLLGVTLICFTGTWMGWRRLRRRRRAFPNPRPAAPSLALHGDQRAGPV